MADVTPPNNPYVVGRPVTGPGHFVGRRKELRQLKTLLLDSKMPQHVSITGETRTGKTSLLREFIRQEEQTLNERYIVLMLDLSADFDECNNPGLFYQRLGDFVIDRAESVGASIDEAGRIWEKGQASRRRLPIQHYLKNLLETLAQNARPQLIVLDEFDEAPNRTGCSPDAFKILRNLGLYSDVTFLIASRAEIVEIEQDAGISSNFAGIFSPFPIQVGILQSDEARDLCQEPLRANGLRWHSGVVDALLRLSGRHPYLLQGLCHRLLAESWGVNPSEQCEVLEATAFEVFQPLFLTLARRLQRNTLMKPLCELLRGNTEEVDPVHTDQLQRLGYLTRDELGRFAPFTPLLLRALNLDTVPSDRNPDDGAVEERLMAWGFSPGRVNVIVEGETDRDYLQLAADHHKRTTGESLLDGLVLVPAGLRREGGVRVVARRLIVAQETAKGTNTRFIALFDYDEIGRKIGEALSKLGGNKNRDYMFLDRRFFPIKNYNGQIEVEIEDLLSQTLLDEFAKFCPEAIEEHRSRGTDGVRYCWKGKHKDALVQFVCETATTKDLENLVECLRQVRKNVGL